MGVVRFFYSQTIRQAVHVQLQILNRDEKEGQEIRMEKFKSWLKGTLRILIVILFGISVYLVWFSVWGIHTVAEYNKGYGVFGMHFYTVESVAYVLFFMKPEGFTAYYQYLLADTLFIASLAIMQVMLANFAYSKRTKDGGYKVLILFTVLRGICDLVENSCIYYVLRTFPDFEENAVDVASIATLGKYISLIPWGMLLLSAFLKKWSLARKKR